MAIIVVLVPLLVRAPPLITLSVQIAAGAAFYLLANIALQRPKLRAALGDLLVSRS
jgi:hypothetical protein